MGGRCAGWPCCSWRRFLAGRVLFSGVRRFGRFPHHAELAHCRQLYVPDRQRIAARTAKIADPPLAGSFRSHAARRHLSVPGRASDLSRPIGNGSHGLARSWIAVFVIEIVLYVVGTAFIVLILAKDRTVHFYKTAAATDPLTGVLNRRGFFEGGRHRHATQSQRHDAGQRARLRPRSFQIDQRPLWPCRWR